MWAGQAHPGSPGRIRFPRGPQQDVWEARPLAPHGADRRARRSTPPSAGPEAQGELGHEEAPRCSEQARVLAAPNGRRAAFPPTWWRMKRLGPERSPGREASALKPLFPGGLPRRLRGGGLSDWPVRTPGDGHGGSGEANSSVRTGQGREDTARGWGRGRSRQRKPPDTHGRARTHTGLGSARVVPRGPRGTLPRAEPWGSPGTTGQPPWAPRGPPRHGGCAPGLGGRAGEEPRGLAPGPRRAPGPPGPPGRLPPRFPAPPRPPLTYLPRSSAHRRPRTGRPQAARRHDGCSACLFKSGSLSPRSAQAQRSGPKLSGS
ncbi:collagen alpha-1(I) chain-like isoform X2 [Felis catus]|uniref:collagen alpha-1(I) chain-like isoform X2 n=1 Tax=Felis catus TaxID=9685 RepID=UPI001D19FA31|nr:collagen alpha-1(I) chain-like isoform X2 [Felis catus]